MKLITLSHGRISIFFYDKNRNFTTFKKKKNERRHAPHSCGGKKFTIYYVILVPIRHFSTPYLVIFPLLHFLRFIMKKYIISTNYQLYKQTLDYD